ncbi:putative ABC transporter permease [Paenibacillus sp. FSL H7-0357]|uniref:putative ABC transporter permease n=1 Tax=Paenibacillus sp. FSL H7-0357 TaxID=1536774 RepID=UPI003FA58409
MCVEYSLLWGFIACLLTEFLHPAVSRMLALAPERMIMTAAWCVQVYFIFDALSFQERVVPALRDL